MKGVKGYLFWGVNPFLVVLVIAYTAQSAYFPFLRSHVLPFILFACIYLFIPAFTLSKCIFRETNWGAGTKIVLAYPLVLCAHFVVAWAITILQAPLLVHMLPIISIAAFFLFRRHSTDSETVIALSSIHLTVLLFAISMALMWVGLWAPDSPPTEGKIGAIYQDHLWNIGNIWSAIRGGWPLMDARVFGEPLSYHLSQSFIHSVAYRVTDIHPFYLQIYFFPILDLLFLSVVLVLVGQAVGGFSFSSILWLSVVLFISKGWGWYYHGHLYWNPLTFFFSLAPFTVFVFVTKSYFEGRIKLPILYLACLYTFLVATKATLALIILPALAVTFVLRVLRGEAFVYKQELLLGVFCVAETFAVKYMLFSSGGERGMFIGTAIKTSRVFWWLSDKLNGVSTPIIEFIFGIYLLMSRAPIFLISPAGGVLIFATLLYAFKDRMLPQRASAWIYFVVAMISVSLIENYFLKFEEYADGASIYFEWYPMWMLPLLAAWLISRIQLSRRDWTIVIGITSVGVASFAASVVPYTYSILEGKSISQVDTRATIDFGEWKALMWVNSNVPEGAVIASDRRAFRGTGKTRDQSRFFAYSALSGRQMLMEGEDFMGGEGRTKAEQRWSQFEKILSSNDLPALRIYLQATPAQYFFQSLRFNNMDLSRLPGYRLIYENSTTRVFNIGAAR